MLRLTDSFSPEEISQLEIDDVLRDRLYFDPQWQEIVQAIRQDIMLAKWGGYAVGKSLLERYGTKVYPLLNYYSHSDDKTRQQYGIEVIRQLGKPYTTLWLREEIQRQIIYTNSSFGVLYFSVLQDSILEKEFGLDDPKVREELISLAKANLKPKNHPHYYRQFNYDFLVNKMGYKDSSTDYEGEYKYQRLRDRANGDNWINSEPDWVKFEQLQQPTDAQIDDAISFYQKRSSFVKGYILSLRLGKIKAGEITPFARAFFHSLVKTPSTNEEKATDRIWAIAELDRHGDTQGSELLQDILDNDLSQLILLDRVENNRNSSGKGFYAYWLLLGMVEKYPQSKFAIACREYGDLTGYSYFGHEPRSQEILNLNAKMTDKERSEAWQDWLNRYSDHLGADDASYHLAVSLQNNNDIVGAMRVWIGMISRPIGDNDANFRAFPHIRTLLDVGLSIDQMQILVQEPENQDFAMLLQYAIVIQYARSQNYAKALEIASNIKIEAIPNRIVEAYYHSRTWYPSNITKFKKQAQLILNEQKLRWQKLHQWQVKNTPESRYQIATDWAGNKGWENGYLPIWDDWQFTEPNTWRLNKLPTEDWDCKEWWVCDTAKRNNSEMLASYQGSSQNAIAISLYQQLLEDNSIPAAIREKTLYMVAMTLLNQLENHHFRETIRIHPPLGVVSSVKFQPTPDKYGYIAYHEVYKSISKSIRSDYQKRIDDIIAELQSKFPQSTYLDDLLFSSFFLSKQPRYLQVLLDRYPNSDRAAEAKFLLGLK
jgi:hypothetical protein